MPILSIRNIPLINLGFHPPTSRFPVLSTRLVLKIRRNSLYFIVYGFFAIFFIIHLLIRDDESGKLSHPVKPDIPER